jgi:D-alanyl-lipoteichoic acid acyltransferase DltB (MBOAT superfamily)
MVFSSFPFLFVFLPAVLGAFHLLGRFRLHSLSQLVLVLASLIFYGVWDVRFLPLLLGSILFNYLVGGALEKSAAKGGPRRRKALLAFGVGIDLLLLGVFKYTGFALTTANHWLGLSVPVPEIILPLGISFFTFTQIAFLADAYKGRTVGQNLIEYALFVTIFPHLIAGPILHHRDMIPQFRARAILGLNPHALAVGFTVLTLGLLKKVLIADSMAGFAGKLFQAAELGGTFSFLEAWTAALAYTLQIYFDFSGYSDMAIGLGAMIGVRLPMNFNSPYKALSIIDFWRRWHMTLSAFLRDYLYFPLGGNRMGPLRRYLNLAVVMLLGGLWHGAAWNFVLWGALHGFYLMVNHAWRALRPALPLPALGWFGKAASWFLTFLAVVIAWVPFRAQSLDGAWLILRRMAGLDGLTLTYANKVIEDFASAPNWLALSMLLVLLAPNLRDWMGSHWPGLQEEGLNKPGRPKHLAFTPSPAWGVALGAAAAIGLLGLSHPQIFIYFQF